MSSFEQYADTVQQLVRFAEVRTYLKQHIETWRRKKSLIRAIKAKAEEALERWLRHALKSISAMLVVSVESSQSAEFTQIA